MYRTIFVNPGTKRGMLTVISEAEKKYEQRQLLCKCDCGNEATVSLYRFIKNKTHSCGCYKKIASKKSNTRHGCRNTRIYRVWKGMKYRCLNPHSKDYKNYGGRGIKIHAAWKEFQPFYNWAIESGYRDDLSIDRKDNDGNYEPGNCRWISNSEQQNNTRANVIISHNGRSLTLSQWSRELKIARNVLLWRLSSGWSTEEAFTTPIRINIQEVEGNGKSEGNNSIDQTDQEPGELSILDSGGIGHAAGGGL